MAEDMRVDLDSLVCSGKDEYWPRHEENEEDRDISQLSVMRFHSYSF